MSESQQRAFLVNKSDISSVEPPKHTKAEMWTFVTPKMQDNKAFELMLTTMQPGGAAETGSHATEHAYYVISGQMQVTVDGKKYDMGPESCLYMDKYAEHSLVVVGDEPVNFVVIFAPARQYA